MSQQNTAYITFYFLASDQTELEFRAFKTTLRTRTRLTFQAISRCTEFSQDVTQI